MAWARWWLRIRFAVAMSSTTTSQWDLASHAVNWWSLLVRTASTRACARPRRRRALARFADPFWVRDSPRCRCLRWARAPPGAGDFQGRDNGAVSGGDDRCGLDPDVHPDRGTHCSVVRLWRSCHGAFEAHRRVPATARVPAYGDVQYPGPAAGQQPPKLGLRPARRAQGDPPVLGYPQATRLQVQTVGDREPWPV